VREPGWKPFEAEGSFIFEYGGFGEGIPYYLGRGGEAGFLDHDEYLHLKALKLY